MCIVSTTKEGMEGLEWKRKWRDIKERKENRGRKKRGEISKHEKESDLRKGGKKKIVEITGKRDKNEKVRGAIQENEAQQQNPERDTSYEHPNIMFPITGTYFSPSIQFTVHINTKSAKNTNSTLPNKRANTALIPFSRPQDTAFIIHNSLALSKSYYR